MKNGILFDLDGTLWDASIPIVQCWNDVFRRKGADKQLSLDDMHLKSHPLSFPVGRMPHDRT